MKYSKRILNTPASFIRRILAISADPNIISFAGGLPNPTSFPREDIQVSMDSIIRKYGDKLFQYATTPGYEPLRQYIADKYNDQHHLGLTADDILITTGSQQALDLIGKVIINEGDGVIIEEPGYLGAIQAFSLYQPDFLSVPLEQTGLDTATLSAALQQPNVKCMYTVPNFQNPSGLTYSKENRLKVAQMLQGQDVFLIEDDPYGELRFRGEPLPYIGANDREHSILLGSFSKTVTPGMRLGFIITRNKELMNYINIAKQASDLHSSIFSQILIYDYLINNDYQTHINKIIDMYREQSDTMLAAMDKYFPDYVQYTKPEGGMFIWVTLPKGQSAMELFDKAMAKNVAFVPGNPFYTTDDSVNTFRLNYTNSTTDAITEGIKRLGSVL
jgi:Transcriptional regulators containing a DNA-binding HTH domain and an aminotransferase domain (MocR family) and their eukaryotic orthologs